MIHVLEAVVFVGWQKVHVENVDTLSSMDVTHGQNYASIQLTDESPIDGTQLFVVVLRRYARLLYTKAL